MTIEESFRKLWRDHRGIARIKAIITIAVIAGILLTVAGGYMHFAGEPEETAVQKVTLTPTPTPSPTPTPTLALPMREETITFVLTNESQVVIDAINERVGYSKTSDFAKGTTKGVVWQKRQNHYDIVNLPSQWRLEIDWESREYRGPYTVPTIEEFPMIPSVNGKAVAKDFGHIQFT